MSLSIIILAAGSGKRMRSETSKVLHLLGGKPLLARVIDTALKLVPAQPPIIVFGHQGEKVRSAFADLGLTWVEQPLQLGTGHAVLQALPSIPANHQVLILSGDVPLISLQTLNHLIRNTPADAIGIITAHFAHPKGLGRIIRNTQGHISHIVEEKDATDAERQLTEINSGIYLIPAHYLKKWLPKLTQKNVQQEFYLPDIIAMATHEKMTIHSTSPTHPEEIQGINDRLQLAELERFHQKQLAEEWMRQGVTLQDPTRLDIRGDIHIGTDVVIDINVILEGHVTIGNHCVIGASVILRNVILGDHVEIKAFSILDGAEIADGCIIGPFARIRPGTVLAEQSHIGNFVEIKNSLVGASTKINHLSYIGDCEIGKQVNVGAGTITCNYDGVNKHKTQIGDQSFIGSNTSLVAPLTIGTGATIGAGSTITRDAPPLQLTLSRATQRSIEHWQRPNKEKKES